MINLLPPQFKKELSEEKNWKLTIILGILILAFFISLALILFSIKTLISTQAQYQKALLDSAEEEFKDSEFQNLEKEITFLNQTFFELDSFYRNKFSLNEILEKIPTTLPPGIYLTSFSFSPAALEKREEYRFEISLTGFSPTRKTLKELEENLKTQTDFKEVYFPLSNWAEPADINFYLTFKLE